jgi:uncharacterized protein
MKTWEILFRSRILENAEAPDPAHDVLHFSRVVKTAKHLCELEKAKLEVVIPAAWLHDLVLVPKNDPALPHIEGHDDFAVFNF